MSHTPENIAAAIKHLRRRDPVLKQLIDTVGPFTLKLRRNRFDELVRAIVAQQISGSAARSIQRRLIELIAPAKISPESLAPLTPKKLRTAGISPQKAGYLLDLANKVQAGEVRLHRLSRMTDDEVVAELIQVKGIGEWTAQMLMMFSLGRLDVFPHNDLGIRSALQKMYGLADLPDKQTSHAIAQPWRPYASIASWYCWRVHEVEFNPR